MAAQHPAVHLLALCKARKIEFTTLIQQRIPRDFLLRFFRQRADFSGEDAKYIGPFATAIRCSAAQIENWQEEFRPNSTRKAESSFGPERPSLTSFGGFQRTAVEEPKPELKPRIPRTPEQLEAMRIAKARRKQEREGWESGGQTPLKWWR